MEPSESEPVSAAEERLRQLEERLNRASDAAERLMAEAAKAAAREVAGESGADESSPAGKPPPAGWQTPQSEESASRGRGELELLMQVVDSVRDLIPPDLQRRLAEALRELLMALRALIDWYLDRSEGRRREAAEVQDIPIR